jgi:2-keto-4-pentenoate hydratase/2-oxohepta-3-ene-1,7-dioic acid hydratase in catechol pathway
MKLVTFSSDEGKLRPGVLGEGGVIDLSSALPEKPSTLRDVLAGDMLGRVVKLVQDQSAFRVTRHVLTAPVPDPANIIAIGLNYRDHAIESGMAIPEEPIVFGKFTSSVCGPEEAISLPSASHEVDYEAELVVVMGRRASHVPQSEAMEYVAGYTIGNDVSARDWQLRKPGGQWTLGKSFATFAPIGPALVTRDEIPDPHTLSIQLKLNGQVMQSSNTSQLIFRIDQLVSYLSQAFPLQPGDLIFTGTPPGVGFARKPPVFLQPGDVCEVEIEGLGILRNTCRRG